MIDGKLLIAPTCYHVLHLIPVMVAHEMGLFYDEGLRTEAGFRCYEIQRQSLVPFGLEKFGITQAMKERSVDIALDVQSRTVFFQRARGADLYIIAGWRNQHVNVWVGAPGIKSLKELKGKRVGVGDLSGNRQWGISIWLRKAGLNLEQDVEWVTGIFPPTHLEALRTGKIDCGPVAPWEVDNLRKQGFNLLLSLRDQYPNGRPERVIAATGAILEDKPMWVKSFLKGMIRAYWFIRDQPHNFDYVNKLEKRLRLESLAPNERVGKFVCQSPVDMEGMPFPIDGRPTGFEDLLAEEKTAGELSYDVPDIKEVCALDLVEEAFQELRERPDLADQFERVSGVAKRLGY
ncbi:MAG: ABC transporter substrate-binding protein [Deltaproteobacteria bacterium]|nr:ABC transporter substrate-binding protein [Deltaproteobacteria bacterium]